MAFTLSEALTKLASETFQSVIAEWSPANPEDLEALQELQTWNLQVPIINVSAWIREDERRLNWNLVRALAKAFGKAIPHKLPERKPLTLDSNRGESRGRPLREYRIVGRGTHAFRRRAFVHATPCCVASGKIPPAFRTPLLLSLPRCTRDESPPLVRCAILCLEQALESEMGSMHRQHRNGGTRDSQAAVLSVLASKRVVLDRHHGRKRLNLGLGNLTDSAK